MITLTIKKSDGSVYWTEYFDYRADAEKWLAVEKTRPYWEKEHDKGDKDKVQWTYTITGEDYKETPIDPSEIEAKKQEKIADLNKAKDIAELKTFIIDNLL